MNSVIRELPPLLRDKIAAGEVVERPASVVKELVENAIDAGATLITVEIEKGGREFISVSDNGSGISPEYIKTAFLPHATSKIVVDEDLETITTKGFRGEALASIAAVSDTEVVSKTADSEFALSYHIVAGIGGEVRPAARDIGTTITVSRLFYNTPARLKFLKSDAAEGTAVTDLLGKIALAHPEIAFTLIKDGATALHSRADGDLLTAINSIVAKDIHKFLRPLDFEEDGYCIKGFVGTAEGARATRSMQYFYVNGRYIKNKSFNAAVDNAVSGLFLHGKHPMVFLFLTLPPAMVDVNVHPAKIEVRFAEERKVFSAIYRAIKSALTERVSQTVLPSEPIVTNMSLETSQTENATPVVTPYTQPLTLKSPVMTYSAPPRTGYIKSANIDIEYIDDERLDDTHYIGKSPADTSLDVERYNKAQSMDKDSDDLPTEAVTSDNFQPLTKSNDLSLELKVVGEVFATYIVLEHGDEMLLLDKHAAHERIIYERLISQRSGEIDEQILLTPLTVNIDGEHKATLLDNSEYLKQLGIEIEDFGTGSVRLYSLPADIDGYNAEKLLVELAEGLMTGGVALDERTRWVYHSVACRAAIKSGDRLQQSEMLHLASEILGGDLPLCCPHGRPVFVSFTKKELEGRIGRS